MLQARPLVIIALTAIGLVVAPFVLPHLGVAPTTVNRILIWGLFGLGFDILFGFTGLLSFGQSAFFGTGGMVAAYLLTETGVSNVIVALFAGMVAAAAVGFLVGLIALRRTGIYFAMITVAIAEVFYFVEFSPLSDYTGGENGLPGVPPPSLGLGFRTVTFDFGQVDLCVPGVLVLCRARDRAAHRALAGRRRPEGDPRQSAARRGGRPRRPKVQADGLRDRRRLCGLCGRPARPDAGLHAARRLHLRHLGAARDADRHRRRGHPVRPAGRRRDLALSQRLLPEHAASRQHLEARLGDRVRAARRLPRHGVVGGMVDLVALVRASAGGKAHKTPESARSPDPALSDAPRAVAAPKAPAAHDSAADPGDVILETKALTRRYGGLLANRDIDFAIRRGELRGVIGPNGAGKSTFFKMLTCEVAPSSGQILFENHDITGWDVTRVCQLGLTKSYQVNQLFNRLTVRENVAIAALAERRGRFRADLLRDAARVPGLVKEIEETLDLVRLSHRAETHVSDLAYGEKRRLEIGLALATRPSLLLLDEPLAGMSPQRARRDRRPLEVDPGGAHAGRDRP